MEMKKKKKIPFFFTTEAEDLKQLKTQKEQMVVTFRQMGFGHLPEPMSEPRGPPPPEETPPIDADADDGDASESLKSAAVLGARTKADSVGFMPRKSWKTGFTICWLVLLLPLLC